MSKWNRETSSDLPQWAMAMESYFGVSLNESQIKFWRSEIDPITRRDEEIVDAIRFAAGKGRDSFKGKPALKDLRIWIFWMRKENRENKGVVFGRDVDFPGKVKDAMLKGKDFVARWNIMCDPGIYAGLERTTTHDECMELERWAWDRWDDWAENKAAFKDQLRRQVRVTGDFGAAMMAM